MMRLQQFALSALLYATLLISSALAEGYKVQVGDELAVDLPGEATLSQPFIVDRQGQITLPEIGNVNVAGFSETELTALIREQLSTLYYDLDYLRVYVTERNLLLRIEGYVQTPGDLILPAASSVQVALHKAGGLRPGAQLDRIQLRRDGEVQVFNYKAFLDSGDRSLLPQLRSLDTLFVPASPMIGNIEQEFDPAKLANSGDAAESRSAVKVFGEVNSPGSFSHNDAIGLIELLMRAGGVTRYATVEQIRIITSGEPKLFNLKRYLDSGDESLLPEITAGATIFVPKQEEEIKSGSNTVYVMGEVAKPGAFEGKPGATFMDILANAGGPTRYAETRMIRILKADGRIIPFDLSGYTEGTNRVTPPVIETGDALFVPEKVDMNEKSWLKVAPDRAVRVLGEVVRPSRVEWSNEMSLLDLLAHVGGPTSRADTSKIDVVIPRPNGSSSVIRFNLDEFIQQGQSDSELPVIVAGTTVRVHDLPQDPVDNKSQWVRQSSDLSIYVFGQVGAPGRYRFNNDMNLLDILSAADGPTMDADLHNIRITHRNAAYAKVSHVNLAMYFETGDPSLLPDVQTGDSIYIPEKDRIWLEHSKESTVRVLGAINKPGRYRFNDDMTILDLLAEAGGTSQNAYVQKITVVNLSCCKDQAQVFDLADFSRTARFQDLPVLRAGDTVYVPSRDDSNLAKWRQGFDDVVRVVSFVALIGLL